MIELKPARPQGTARVSAAG